VNSITISGLTSALDIYEIDVMSSGMNHGPESQRICDLSVEPDIFIGGKQPSKLGSDNTDNIAQHGDEDKTTVEGKHQTSATRCPNRVFQSVETSQLEVGCLWENKDTLMKVWMH
jgi:hypothetical protein